MTAVYYLSGALEDIERLAAFLLESDPPAAAETKSLIESAIGILASHPLIGRSPEPGLRDEIEDRVLVLAIRHQREAGYF